MLKGIQCRRALAFLVTPASLWLAGCDFLDPDDTPPEERAVCAALDVGSAQEFLGNDNTATFEQLDNDEPAILFTSPRVSEALDGQDVIELEFARVEFDFENETVDPFDAGGFWGRWIMVIVPFDVAILQEFQNAITSQELRDLLNVLRNDINRTEVQLSGPFLRTGCEWGDTDQIGTQTIRYSNYGVYDWDFFPNFDRVLGIVFESDDGVNDDFIAWLDISRTSGGVVLEEPGSYRIDLNALANISLAP